MAQSDLEIPKYGSKPETLLSWCLEAQQEGEAWLKCQRPAAEWDSALQMLSEPAGGDVLAGLSKTGYNVGARIARELVAGLSDFTHEGEYKPTWNRELFDQAQTLTNLDDHWYRTTRVNATVRAGIQYGVALGTGYFWQTWDKNYWAPSKGDIRIEALHPGDVTFVQLPKDHNLQRAYAVIIREELPLNLARSVYADLDHGRFARQLTADRDAPGWLQRGLRKLQQFVSPALRVAGRQQQQQGSFPTVDIFHMYTLDSTINDGAVAREMGMPGTNWAYKVPAIDDPLPTAVRNPATGNFFTRPAGREDCQLFPLRRYTIFSRTATGYDGSSPYWHGQAPIARLRFNDWAWEALGKTILGDLKSIQDGIVALMRAMEDTAAARLDPPYLYDDQLVDSSWAKAFNPRMAGARAAAPLQQGKVIEFPVDPSVYDVPGYIPEFMEAQERRMKYLSGVEDLVAMAKARQVPGADTIEKLMELAGPIVRDNFRALEDPLYQLGEQRKALYFQFYTTARMISVTGLDGNRVDQEYTPDKLVSYQSTDTAESRAARAKTYISEFRYEITESGISEFNRMSEKLLYIQLQKAGFPIDWWTLAKVNRIPNFGPEPEGTNTVMERFIAQKQIEIDLVIEQQKRVAEFQMAMGGVPGGGGAPGEGGGGAAPAGGGDGGGQPGGGQEGRPASFKRPPKLESKDGGSRSTISTS